TVLEILPGTELYWIEKYESVVKTGAPLHYENYSKELDRYFEVAAYRNQENQFAVITTDITERHKIEQEIRINNHHINSIFRAAPIGIGVTVDRVIREANPQFFEMIGYSKEEILGQNTQMFYPNFETYQLVGENKYKQIAETGNGTVETQWKRKNGEIIDVLISSTPIIPDQLSQGVTFIATDITKRKCEEKILQAQVRLFEMVETFSKNELILAALNEIENLTSSSISFFHPYNEAKKEVSFGLWSANAIHEFGDLLISQITEYSIDHAGIWADCIRKRKPVIYNDYINLDHKKGLPKNHITINRILTIPIIRNKSVVAVLGVGNKASDYNQSDIEIANRLANLIWEVLERKNAEDQIQKLSVGIEQSPTIVVITDKDGKIEYVNPRFTEITGYTRSEAIGNTPRILYSGRQSKKFYKDLWNTILNGENWTGEMVNKTKSGAFYWESAVISPVKDSSGKLTHFIAIKEDITLRKENDLLLLANERKLKEQNEEYLAINEELTESNYKILNINEELIIARQHAEQSDKLKTAFLANISHEIRTPLNGIIGFTRMLCKPNFDQTKLSYFHQIIKNSSDQLLAIINDVIDIAKIEAGQIDVYEEEVNVNYEIEKALSVFSENARHKEIEIRAELALPDEMSILFTDKGKFNQVINNLINNAVKFTSQGSVTIGYKIVETKIQFYVSDTGIGINKKDQGLIFDRFRQVEIEETRKFGGTGLGLSISKAFVEALGGEIWVQSDAYTGSTFFFSLPYKDVLDSKIPDVLDKNYIVNLQGITVLVAEDEETNKIFMTELIKETHATVLIAQNGVEAVAMAKKHRPNIILMDIKMPEMDGLTATKLIKKEFPEILIVATTAYALSGDKDRFLTAGCDGYLAKPIIKEELMQTINQLVFGKKR
ncbi:MAG: PAS domain S-box protein, partial [Salinivirgaceae bacterium]|nr:PAS domain S-box protein [Salinivirgaceae bacterium]